MPTFQTSAKLTEDADTEWILSLDNVLKLTDEEAKPGLRARIKCSVVQDKVSFILPPEMDELQPDVLEYLHLLGAAYDITLVEERRTTTFIPKIDQRNERPTDLALGVSLLLKQTGLPGPAHCLSNPHMLNPENKSINIARLIKMIAGIYCEAKRVEVEPNRFLSNAFSQPNKALTGYACKVVTCDENFVVCYFNGSEFHSIGYIAHDQFVMHVFLAGGPASNPQLWGSYSTMTDSTLRCQLFKSAVPGCNFGLIYNTLYFDLNNVWNHDRLRNKTSVH